MVEGLKRCRVVGRANNNANVNLRHTFTGWRIAGGERPEPQQQRPMAGKLKNHDLQVEAGRLILERLGPDELKAYNKIQ